MSNFFKNNAAIFTVVLLASVPFAAFASGHTTAGLEGLWILGVVMAFAAFAVIINVVSLVLGLSWPSAKARVILYISIVVDILWLAYCGSVWARRVEEHHMYQHYGPDVDAEGYSNFSLKAATIVAVIVIALALNVVLLVRNYRGRK